MGKLRVTLNSIEKSSEFWPLTGVYSMGSFSVFTGNYLRVDVDDRPNVLTASVDFGPNTFAFGLDFTEKVAYDDTKMLVAGENFVVSELLRGAHTEFVGLVSDVPLSSAPFHDPYISGHVSAWTTSVS